MTGTGSVLRRTGAAIAATLVIAVGGAAHVAAQAPAEWNIAMIGGPVAGSGVTIAVVDSGVDADHVAFGGPSASRVLPGIDLVDDDGDADDGNGHGTHVAGTAAGSGINCGGNPTSIGVAPEMSILPVRVLDDDGSGTLDDVNQGIRAAADAGAGVINLSLGEVPSLFGLASEKDAFVAAMAYAWDRGSIPVLAAGNDGEGLVGNLLFPSGYGDIDAVVVTAVTDDNRRASYASGADSARWGIAAPGGDGDRPVLSAGPGARCVEAFGTSMAAPHVSGALAVLLSRGLTPRAAVDRILSTAAPSGSNTGAGLLDLSAALQGLPAPSTTTGSPPTSPTTSAQTPTTPVATSTPTSAAPADSSSSTTETTAPSIASVDTGDDEQATPASPQGQISVDVAPRDEVPGAAAAVAALGVVAVWFGWVAAVRRALS